MATIVDCTLYAAPLEAIAGGPHGFVHSHAGRAALVGVLCAIAEGAILVDVEARLQDPAHTCLILYCVVKVIVEHVVGVAEEVTGFVVEGGRMVTYGIAVLGFEVPKVEVVNFVLVFSEHTLQFQWQI